MTTHNRLTVSEKLLNPLADVGSFAERSVGRMNIEKFGIWFVMAAVAFVACSSEDDECETLSDCPQHYYCSQGACRLDRNSNCTPDCAGRICGLDPVCNTSCGSCNNDDACNAAGQCVSECEPQCGTRVCGPDPLCDISCGLCDSGECMSGQCCEKDCAFRACGLDPVCGLSCGTCDIGSCNESGQCVDDGPFSDFTIWRDSCGNQLWGRWQNSYNFTLWEKTITYPDASSASEQFFDGLGFTGGMNEAWLLSDAGEFVDGEYEILFEYERSGSSTSTTLTRTVEDSLYYGPQIIIVQSARIDGYDGLQATVLPSFNGTVQRVFTYDSTGCLITWKVFYTEPSLSNGVSSEINIGDYYESGTSLTLSFEGIDNDAYYTYYTAVDVVVP